MIKIDEQPLLYDDSGDRSGQNLKGGAVFRLMLVEGQKETVKHDRPDMAQYRIGTGSKERLDLQLLPDPPEKQFDLPARSVNGRNDRCSKDHVIGKKLILMPGFQVGIAGRMKRFPVFFPGCISDQAVCFVMSDMAISYRLMLSANPVLDIFPRRVTNQSPR
jgi:hypothetical protein